MKHVHFLLLALGISFGTQVHAASAVASELPSYGGRYEGRLLIRLGKGVPDNGRRFAVGKSRAKVEASANGRRAAFQLRSTVRTFEGVPAGFRETIRIRDGRLTFGLLFQDTAVRAPGKANVRKNGRIAYSASVIDDGERVTLRGTMRRTKRKLVIEEEFRFGELSLDFKYDLRIRGK